MLKSGLAVIGLLLGWASPAQCLCIYHGVDNAKTTLEQEFRDSRWVVRAHLMSADYHWADAGENWTLYKLRIVERFKGNLRRIFRFYTTRDSGGFYLDGKDAGSDFGADFLLFLVPFPHHSGDPPAARGALWVDYNCGQSRPWIRVTRAEVERLRVLARRP